MTKRTWGIVAFAVLASSCGGNGDGAALFVEARWELECAGAGNCPGGLPSYDYAGETGDVLPEGTIVARCTSVALMNGDRLFDVVAALGEDGVEIDSMIVRGDTTVVGTACTAVFRDGVNEYEGGCNGAASSHPCSISDVVVDRNDPRGPSLAFRILCDDIIDPVVGNSVVRDVRDPAVIGSAAGAYFRFANCSGL